MRLLRHLLPKARRPRRYAPTPGMLAPLELEYDPLVAQLANQCR